MTVLYVFQWASPTNAWVNMKVGGVLRIAGEGLRPSGTFAMSPGAAYYNPLVIAIFISALLSPYYRKRIISVNKYAIYCLASAIIITLAVSVSRGTVIQSGISAVFICITCIICGQSKLAKQFLISLIIIYLLFTMIAKLSIGGKNILEPILTRFEVAAEQEGGSSGILETRVLEPYRFWNDKGETLNPPTFGYGIGAGSNFGTQALNLGNGKAWGLGEWSSQIVTNEMGIIFGAIVFFLRVGFCFYLLPICIRLLKRNKDILPICLWTLSVNYFGNGNINLTMAFGWIVVVMILILLSIRTSTRIYNT